MKSGKWRMKHFIEFIVPTISVYCPDVYTSSRRPAYQLGHRLRGVIRKFDRQPPFAQGWRRGFYLPAGRLLIDGTQHILQALVLETDVAGVAVKELRILRLADEQTAPCKITVSPASTKTVCSSCFSSTFTFPRFTDKLKGSPSLLLTLKAVPSTSTRTSPSQS